MQTSVEYIMAALIGGDSSGTRCQGLQCQVRTEGLGMLRGLVPEWSTSIPKTTNSGPGVFKHIVIQTERKKNNKNSNSEKEEKKKKKDKNENAERMIHTPTVAHGQVTYVARPSRAKGCLTWLSDDEWLWPHLAVSVGFLSAWIWHQMNHRRFQGPNLLAIL